MQAQATQPQIPSCAAPPTISDFEYRWKVKFKSTGSDYILRGQTGLISHLYGRLYIAAVWVDYPFIRQLKELGFTQMQEGRLRDWYFPDDAYTTSAQDAAAVSLAFQIIGKMPNQKTRKALLAAIQK